jgi:hypothetical protein
VTDKPKIYPTTLHNIAKAAGARLVGPHYTNGLYTLHLPDRTYLPNIGGDEVVQALDALPK